MIAIQCPILSLMQHQSSRSVNVVLFVTLLAMSVDIYRRKLEEVSDALLKEIVRLYVAIRGFSYASFWVEKYKQLTTKSTQRSKSLCRDLYDSSL